MGLDLHTHSTASDGKSTPARLVEQARRAGLDGIALTDHDTVAGLDEAVAVGRRLEMPVVPGIEFTTDYRNEEVHILGYGIDWHAPELLRKLDLIVQSRRERAEGMLKRLARVGINLSLEEVKAQTTGEYIGRPHIYRAMKAAGWIGEDPERKAFAYYLGTHGVAYLPHREIDALEALDLVLAAGGVPVLAHPGRLGRTDFVKKLVDNGLAGLEVYYPLHGPGEVRKYEKLAGKFGLLMTGGSDYHGEPDGQRLGECQAPNGLLPLLRRRERA